MARKKLTKRKRTKSYELLKFKKFGGNICRRLPDDGLLDILCEGDYISYWDNGYRVGRVKKNHKGYKHRWVQIYESRWGEHVLRRSQKIKPNKIREGWRSVEDE